MEIKELLELVVREKASDLLLTAGAPPMLRINGELFRTRHEVLTPELTQDLVYGLLTTEQKIRFGTGARSRNTRANACPRNEGHYYGGAVGFLPCGRAFRLAGFQELNHGDYRGQHSDHEGQNLRYGQAGRSF